MLELREHLYPCFQRVKELVQWLRRGVITRL